LIYYILDPGVAPLKSMLWDFFCAKIQFIMAVISTSQFKRGIYIIFQNEPHMIVDTSFVSPGKGSAFYRTKLKNLYTGRIIEYTYKSGEKVEEVLVETHEAEYSYFDGSNYVFIEPRTFEQYIVPVEIVGDDKVYLKEGLLYRIKFYEETPVGISLPKTIAYTVVEAENSVNKTGSFGYRTKGSGAIVYQDGRRNFGEHRNWSLFIAKVGYFGKIQKSLLSS